MPTQLCTSSSTSKKDSTASSFEHSQAPISLKQKPVIPIPNFKQMQHTQPHNHYDDSHQTNQILRRTSKNNNENCNAEQNQAKANSASQATTASQNPLTIPNQHRYQRKPDLQNSMEKNQQNQPGIILPVHPSGTRHEPPYVNVIQGGPDESREHAYFMGEASAKSHQQQFQLSKNPQALDVNLNQIQQISSQINEIIGSDPQQQTAVSMPENKSKSNLTQPRQGVNSARYVDEHYKNINMDGGIRMGQHIVGTRKPMPLFQQPSSNFTNINMPLPAENNNAAAQRQLNLDSESANLAPLNQQVRVSKSLGPSNQGIKRETKSAPQPNWQNYATRGNSISIPPCAMNQGFVSSARVLTNQRQGGVLSSGYGSFTGNHLDQNLNQNGMAIVNNNSNTLESSSQSNMGDHQFRAQNSNPSQHSAAGRLSALSNNQKAKEMKQHINDIIKSNRSQGRYVMMNGPLEDQTQSLQYQHNQNHLPVYQTQRKGYQPESQFQSNSLEINWPSSQAKQPKEQGASMEYQNNLNPGQRLNRKLNQQQVQQMRDSWQASQGGDSEHNQSMKKNSNRDSKLPPISPVKNVIHKQDFSSHVTAVGYLADKQRKSLGSRHSVNQGNHTLDGTTPSTKTQNSRKVVGPIIKDRYPNNGSHGQEMSQTRRHTHQPKKSKVNLVTQSTEMRNNYFNGDSGCLNGSEMSSSVNMRPKVFEKNSRESERHSGHIEIKHGSSVAKEKYASANTQDQGHKPQKQVIANKSKSDKFSHAQEKIIQQHMHQPHVGSEMPVQMRIGQVLNKTQQHKVKNGKVILSPDKLKIMGKTQNNYNPQRKSKNIRVRQDRNQRNVIAPAIQNLKMPDKMLQPAGGTFSNNDSLEVHEMASKGDSNGRNENLIATTVDQNTVSGQELTSSCQLSQNSGSHNHPMNQNVIKQNESLDALHQPKVQVAGKQQQLTQINLSQNQSEKISRKATNINLSGLKQPDLSITQKGIQITADHNPEEILYEQRDDQQRQDVVDEMHQKRRMYMQNSSEKEIDKRDLEKSESASYSNVKIQQNQTPEKYASPTMNLNCNVPHNTEVTNQATTPNAGPMNTQDKENVSSIKKPADFTTDSPVVAYKNNQSEKGCDFLRFELIQTDQPSPIKITGKENKNQSDTPDRTTPQDSKINEESSQFTTGDHQLISVSKPDPETTHTSILGDISPIKQSSNEALSQRGSSQKSSRRIHLRSKPEEYKHERRFSMNEITIVPHSTKNSASKKSDEHKLQQDKSQQQQSSRSKLPPTGHPQPQHLQARPKQSAKENSTNHYVRKQASTNNLAHKISAGVEEESKDGQSTNFANFQTQADKRREMLRTPKCVTMKDKAKSSQTDMSESDMIKSDMIKTDCQFEDSDAGEMKIFNSIGSYKDVDSENCSLDHTMKVDIDKVWQEELNSVERGQQIGKGSFGVVYQGSYQANRTNIDCNLPPQLAIKVVSTEDEGLIKKLQHECELLRSFRHENIIKYYGCVPKKNEETGKNEQSIFMEFMPHSLKSYYNSFGPLHEKIIQTYTKQILEALKYLHNNKIHIIHGDLKAANILVDGNQIKLTDFGDSRRIKARPLLANSGSVSESGVVFKDEIKGSILWMAPEVLKHGKVARRNDIWSLGCTIIELATASNPWADVTDLNGLFDKLQKLEIPQIPDHLSDECKDFIKRCLIYDNTKRPSAIDLLEDPFILEISECQSPQAKQQKADV